MYRRIGKRLVDVSLAIVGLIVSSPVWFVVSLAILIEDGRPVIFRQHRVGRGGVLFEFMKFRSMPVGAPNVPSRSAREVSITRVGRIIRRTSLDEIPQLINILEGDMSFVGPRPALPAQSRLIELRTANGACDLRPGLTGLAQVSSYDDMPDDEKASYDAIYSEDIRLLKDLRIIVRTIAYLRSPPPSY